MADMKSTPELVTKQDFKPQRIKIKRGSTGGQTMKVDVSKEMGLKSAPERWTTNHEQCAGETSHGEHSSFLVDSPGHNQGSRELFEETRQRSVQEMPELGRAAKVRS